MSHDQDATGQQKRDGLVLQITCAFYDLPLLWGGGRAADSIYPDSPLSCSCCRGKGVVYANSENSPLGEE